ncbi:MCP four helix bundle domain-containing protein (plasmid) [Rhizobium leguminosarum]|nr:MCP four helix bundle domain-containing protein [Rhizobium leguminosarum]
MRRPNIKSSLLLIFSGIALLFGLVAYLAVDGLRNTNGSTEEIATNWLPSVQASQAINLAMTNLRLAYRDHIIAQSDAEKKTREEAIKVAEDTVGKAVDAYLPLASSDHERELIKTIKESVGGYIASSSQLLVLSRANKTEEAGQYLGGEMRSHSDKLKEATAALVELERQRQQQGRRTQQGDLRLDRIRAVCRDRLCGIARSRRRRLRSDGHRQSDYRHHRLDAAAGRGRHRFRDSVR